MSFDDEIDAMKKSLAEKRIDTGRRRRAEALEALSRVLQTSIASRRVEFRLEFSEDGDDDPALAVVHVNTREELGAIYCEDNAFSFEPDDDDYFVDLAEVRDPADFAQQLTQVLKDGLPVFELDVEEEGA